MGFVPLKINTGILADLAADDFPATVFGWRNDRLSLPAGSAHYGIALAGTTAIRFGRRSFTIETGMFFVVPGEFIVESDSGYGLIISSRGNRGLFQIGGPVEAEGRLKYIDGCSDTLLVCPPCLGEPCLNHLHIPPHTSQTEHTHPSVRIGAILRGQGECRTPEGNLELQPGMGWIIPSGSLHSFHTSDESLDVIAWHPDSDFGPTDENHPMINRTVI